MVHEWLYRLGLGEAAKTELADCLEATEVVSGGAIITQGDEGDAMYFIEEGEAEAVIKGVGVVMSYKRGDFFGELALMTAEPRSATVCRGARARVFID